MTRVIFEAAVIADAVRKAARVAPTVRGAAFDKAAGMLFEVDPDQDPPVVLKATDLQTQHSEWVSAVEATGTSARWRLPSVTMSQVIGMLPLRSDRTVVMDDSSGKVEITSDRMRCRYNEMRVDTFPDWRPFDPDSLVQAEGIGGCVKKVEWAALNGVTSSAISGVHLTGEVAMATDRSKAARVPCALDLKQPVTIPAGTLSVLLNESAGVKVGTNGSQLLLMPDDWTQLRVQMMAVEYPPTVLKLKNEFDCYGDVDRDELMGLVSRAVSVDHGNRTPLVTILLGKGELVAYIQSEEVGLFRDAIQMKEGGTRRVEYVFNPSNLTSTVGSCPSKVVRVGYDNAPKSMISVCTPGYEAWVARTRRPGGE